MRPMSEWDAMVTANNLDRINVYRRVKSDNMMPVDMSKIPTSTISEWDAMTIANDLDRIETHRQMNNSCGIVLTPENIKTILSLGAILAVIVLIIMAVFNYMETHPVMFKLDILACIIFLAIKGRNNDNN